MLKYPDFPTLKLRKFGCELGIFMGVQDVK
jgi:hypothetical protein